MKLDPEDYLARLYSSRSLYRLLYEEAVSLLPPRLPEDTKRWDLVSIRSQRDLAEMLGVSQSTVNIDLRRLENWGWIQRDPAKRSRPWRLLGGAIGAELYLMADAVALTMTGVEHLVSSKILPPLTGVKEAAEFQCGPGRVWRPDPGDT